MSLMRIGVVLATIGLAQPQNVTQTPIPKFEVVSIKPCKKKPSGDDNVRIGGSPGRLTFECVTVEGLIRNAYLLYPNGKPFSLPASLKQTFQPIKGSSGWVHSDGFTVNAKVEGPASPEMMRGPMMRVLLADRFKLKIHRETREVAIYELTVAKGGPKLQAAKEGSCTPLDPEKGPPPPRAPGERTPPAICGGFRPSGRNGGLDVSGITLADLCRNFSLGLDRDVFDKTGIAGRFDLHLELSSADLFPRPPSMPTDPTAPMIPADPSGGSISTAVSKLGLKLVPSKMLGEFLVIDHVERPSEN